MNKKLRKLLYLSFDTELTEKEQGILDKALSESEELRNEKSELEKMRASIKKEKRERFGENFADRVMDRIDVLEVEENEPELFFTNLLKLFKPVAIIGATAVIVLSSINLYRGNELSLSSVLGIYEQSYNDFLKTPLESFLGE
jgi:negative regulator of sigma E activity